MQRKPLSIYVHIPFCNSKCHYCAFNSCVASDVTKENYVSNLISEIKLRSKTFGAGRIVKTIYIGGGTPSCLPVNAIASIIEAINSGFVIDNNAEITIEINPNSLTREKVEEYRLCSINRFSVGLQSIKPNLLKILGRTHTSEDYLKSIELLKKNGVENISTDIMIGLPTQTEEDVLESVKLAIKSGVTHLSCYMLEIEEGTNFYKLNKNGLLNPPKEEITILMYQKMKEFLEKNGFHRYEVSNFAKEGCESTHNKIYWDRGDYLGFGLSAHSFVDGIRFANTSSLNEYNIHIENKEIPLEYREEVTPQETIEEMFMLGLRTTKGVNLNGIEKTKGGKEFLNNKNNQIKDLIKDKFVILTPDSYLKLTDKGFMVLDKIIELLAL